MSNDTNYGEKDIKGYRFLGVSHGGPAIRLTAYENCVAHPMTTITIELSVSEAKKLIENLQWRVAAIEKGGAG